MSPSRHHNRTGFSILELMAVIGIILLLMSISVLVMGNVLRSAREKATAATIQKIDGLLRQRQEGFQKAMERIALQKAVVDMKAMASDLFTPEIDRFVLDGANTRTWEILAKKMYFRRHFPQAFAEVNGMDGAPGEQGVDDDGNGTTDFYTTTLSYHTGTPDPLEFGMGANDDLQPYGRLLKERMTNPSLHNPETESSELLYLILTAGELFGAPAVGEDEFSSTEVRDTDGDGLLEFVDGWQRPLRYYRWPTRLLRVNGPASPADPTLANLLIGSLPSLVVNDVSLMRDPDDGLGLIELQIINRNSGGAVAARSKLESFFHTPSTYHTVLIVSAGADGSLGLYEPVQFNIGSNIYGHLAQPSVTTGDPSASPLADNITNRRQQ